MIDKNFLDSRERSHRRKTPDIINYKDYLDHLPQNIQNIMRNRPPEAVHYFEPSDLVSKALYHSLVNSHIHPEGYRVDIFEDRQLVMIVKLLTERDDTFISIFRYLKDRRETVVLITADDSTAVSSQMDDICAKVRENLVHQMRRWNLL